MVRTKIYPWNDHIGLSNVKVDIIYCMKFLSYFTSGIVKRQRLATKVNAIDLTKPKRYAVPKESWSEKMKTNNYSK